MKFFHDEGIVLRKRPLKEKDEIILLLTKHHGKMAFMSYGSRDPKSRKAGIVELCNTIAFEAREGKMKMPTLQQVKMLHSRGYQVVEEDQSLGEFYRASEILKLTDEIIHEGQNVQSVYKDLLVILENVQHASSAILFRIRLFQDLGFLPDWHTCCHCHKDLGLKENLLFSFQNRGFAHHACCQENRDMLTQTIDVDLLKLMNYFQSYSIQDAVKVEVSDHLNQQMNDLLSKIDVSH